MNRRIISHSHTKHRSDSHLLVRKIRTFFHLQYHISKNDFYSATKRAGDIAGSLFLLLVLSPVFLATMILIYLEDRGSIFFLQTRVGYRGKQFKMYKFRSMYKDAEARKKQLEKENETGGVIFKMKNEPRITKTGKWIRKYSIDELPQILNVLFGDMTFVGPRPAVPGEVKLYRNSDRVRLEAKPGITCIWQVSGRSNIPFEKQVLLDRDYIIEQSLLKDMMLLLKTVPAVVMAKGAY